VKRRKRRTHRRERSAAQAFSACLTERKPVLFFFFSNRLGCLGSIAITVIGTLILLMVLGLL
jgi:hypothetical protein